MIARIEMIRKSRSSVERAALLPVYDTFEDYVDIVIQFGYVCMFAVAFPLAPLVALVISFVTLKLRVPSLLFHTQRPRPEGAEGALQARVMWHYLDTLSNHCLKQRLQISARGSWFRK
jgi:hypothetical protein